MEKNKRPRKPTKPTRKKKSAAGQASPRPTRARTELVPQKGRPPATIGGDVPERHRPAVDRLLRLLRTAVGALLDAADAAAGAITRGRGGRGTKGTTP